MVAELAKMEERQTSVQYHCEYCATDFCLIEGEIICPTCQSHDLDQMVIIYQEYDPVPDLYKTKKDWGEGG